MNKLCKYLTVLFCVFAVSYSYGQQGNDNQEYESSNTYSAGGDCSQPCAQPVQSGKQCAQPCEQVLNDCYCLCCRYEPCYYNKWHCNYCPKYTCKKCCRYVPQYYQRQCCRYVPQYYCQTCCRTVPQYYYTSQCHYVPKYSCERCCKYVPKYYYKHTCQPTCTPDSCASTR